jgi:predicted PurR-regulated permease PerM
MSGDAKAPASRSDLPTRFVAGVVMVAVALLAIYIGGWLFRLLVAAAAAAMMVEWGDMHRVRRRWSLSAAAALFLALLISTGWYFAPGEGDIVVQYGEVFDDVWPIVASKRGCCRSCQPQASHGWWVRLYCAPRARSDSR